LFITSFTVKEAKSLPDFLPRVVFVNISPPYAPRDFRCSAWTLTGLSIFSSEC
jgi:hypothetical protein